MTCPCGAPIFHEGKCQDCFRIGLRTSVIARPIKRIKPVERKPRRATIEMLQKVSEGLTIHPRLIYKYRKNGFIKVKYVPELVLTDKGRRVIGV